MVVWRLISYVSRRSSRARREIFSSQFNFPLEMTGRHWDLCEIISSISSGRSIRKMKLLFPKKNWIFNAVHISLISTHSLVSGWLRELWRLRNLDVEFNMKLAEISRMISTSCHETSHTWHQTNLWFFFWPCYWYFVIFFSTSSPCDIHFSSLLLLSRLVPCYTSNFNSPFPSCWMNSHTKKFVHANSHKFSNLFRL